MDGVNDKEKHSDDIHDMEQRKDGVMVNPALQNKELKQYDYDTLEEAANAPISKVDNTEEELEHRASLGKRAWNFIHQHRPELSRELNKGNDQPVVKHDNHRGTVTNPDSDMRLKVNKERDKESGGKSEEESRENLTEKDLQRKEKMINQLDKLNRGVHKASVNQTAAIPYPTVPGAVPKPSPLSNPSPSPSPSPKSNFSTNLSQSPKPSSSPAPSQSAPPRASFVPKGTPDVKTLNPNVPRHIAETTPHVHNVPSGMSQEEAGLRAHPQSGAMVRRLLGPQPATPEKMQGLYKALHKAELVSDNTTQNLSIRKIASPVETQLRNMPRIGTMVSYILGNKTANMQSLSEVRAKLTKAAEKEQDSDIRNEIITGISLAATLLLDMGFTKDGK